MLPVQDFGVPMMTDLRGSSDQYEYNLSLRQRDTA